MHTHTPIRQISRFQMSPVAMLAAVGALWVTLYALSGVAIPAPGPASSQRLVHLFEFVMPILRLVLSAVGVVVVALAVVSFRSIGDDLTHAQEDGLTS